jgi:hypothetical protein
MEMVRGVVVLMLYIAVLQHISSPPCSPFSLKSPRANTFISPLDESSFHKCDEECLKKLFCASLRSIHGLHALRECMDAIPIFAFYFANDRHVMLKSNYFRS